MNLDDVQKSVVDLKRSDWDPAKSDRAKGVYSFKTKVYIKLSDYNDEVARPDHVLKWIGFEDDETSASYKLYRQKYGAEPVTTEDPYFPELADIDAEGHYRYMDTILVKIPLVVWLRKRVEDMERSKKSTHAVVDAEFSSQTKAAGLDIDITKYL